MGALRLLLAFLNQKRRQSAPFLQRSNAMSDCVGPRLLLIAVARVAAVASHHFIARGAEGVALVPVRPLVAVDQDAADAVQRLQVLDHAFRSEEHTSELQSLMRISYAVFCLKKK